VTSDDERRTDPARAVAANERRLEAPHRRGGASPRVVELLAVTGYRVAMWLFAHLPPGPTATVVGVGAQLSYRLWPTKRAWSNRNFGYVLGLPPDHPDVRAGALRAYREYGRYLVELMRLPSRPTDEVRTLVASIDIDEVRRQREDVARGGLIVTVGHIGNNEAVAASIAGYDLPINVVADDSSFPEIFEILRQQRESWGVRVVPWRNLRAIFGVLRRHEMLALLIDWGYRSDGIPVQLFGAWTTLPAGPATLAAKTGSRILPVGIRRNASGRFDVTFSTPITVGSDDPAELQRASQAMADALALAIAAAPEQWYSFKPIWPATTDEMADLERRAAVMLSGVPDPGPGAAYR
jgi:KDO2-lipid IV(A) lauroyltransferase